MGWATEWPTEPGAYWFYGYRFGRVSVGVIQAPELLHLRVRQVSNGMVYICEGHFMSKKDVVEPHFKKITLPKPPILKGYEL